MAEGRSGGRADRHPRQFGRWLADGRLSGRGDRADADRPAAGGRTGRARKPYERRSLHQLQRASGAPGGADRLDGRSEEHTSELQSLMRISYAVFCLKKKKTKIDKMTSRQAT